MNKVTIKDIANLAKVSIGTVDRVIHKRGRVSDETRSRILEIIKETGYQPDIFASRLKRGGNIRYGVVIPRGEQDSGYWNLCLEGFADGERNLQPQGVEVEYFLFDRYSKSNILSTLLLAEKAACSGYILAPVVPGPFYDILSRGGLGKNIVMVDTYLPELEGRADLEVLSFIGPDNFNAGELAGKLTALLIPRNRPVYILDISDGDHHIHLRIEGFLDYYKKNNLSAPSIINGKDTDLPGAAEKLISSALPKDSGEFGLFVPKATTHLYVSACERLGLKKVRTVGFDTVPKNLKLLRADKISFLISQRPVYQACQALYNLHRAYGTKQEIPDRVILPVDIVTSENC